MTNNEDGMFLKILSEVNPNLKKKKNDRWDVCNQSCFCFCLKTLILMIYFGIFFFGGRFDQN